MVSVLRLHAALVVTSVCFGFQPAQPKRHALLIGNGNYAALPKISAPEANVAALEASLKGADFSISTAINATLADLTRTKDAFLALLRPGDAVMIYYSGYAIQVRNDNFLLPVEYKAAKVLEQIVYEAQARDENPRGGRAVGGSGAGSAGTESAGSQQHS
jgi:hypothetical protein